MRYTPNPDSTVTAMLQSMGLSSLDDLFVDIPSEIKNRCDLPNSIGLPELTVAQRLERLAGHNYSSAQYPIFLGAGCYDHYIPAAVTHLLQRSEFYTSYTPYQPEISQGILQSIFEYQSLICQLLNMDVANASFYCGGSALAQACLIATDATRRKRVILPETLHPEYTQIARTLAMNDKMLLDYVPHSNGMINLDVLETILEDQDTAAVVIQYPNFFGILENVGKIVEMAHQTGALIIMSVDPIPQAMLRSPGKWGADIAVGEAQTLGNPMSFGGPHLGFMAVQKSLMRKIPGRLVGETVDSNGLRAYVLTLQPREQHIRREKANSNICSNEALNALAAAMYLTFVGPLGLKQAAYSSHHLAQYAHSQLENAGFTFPYSAPFFREFVVNVNDPSGLNDYLLANDIIGGYELPKGLLLAFTEKRTPEEVDKLVRYMSEFQKGDIIFDDFDDDEEEDCCHNPDDNSEGIYDNDVFDPNEEMNRDNSERSEQ